MIAIIVSMLNSTRDDTRSLNNVNRSAKSNTTCHFDSITNKYSEFLNFKNNPFCNTTPRCCVYIDRLGNLSEQFVPLQVKNYL
jgi:hypothetical protein